MQPVVVRFLRVIVAFGLASVLDTALANLGILELPEVVIPVIAAALAALGKYVRERFPELSGRVPV